MARARTAHRTWSAVIAAVAALAVSAALLPAHASALTRTWTVTEALPFTGFECGEASIQRVRLRPGARAIRVHAPELGDVFDDAVTGAPVARLSEVTIDREDRRRSVRLVAVGSDDVCADPARYAVDGWDTEDVPISISYRTSERVYFPSRCYNAAYRPRTIIVACGDGNYQLHRMRWQRWNGRVARGRGVAMANDCIPYCAAGRFRAYRVTVRLSRPRLVACAGRELLMYTHLRVRYRGRQAPGGPISMRFECLDASY